MYSLIINIELVGIVLFVALVFFWSLRNDSRIAELPYAFNPLLLFAALTFLSYVLKAVVIYYVWDGCFIGCEVTSGDGFSLLAHGLSVVLVGVIFFGVGYFASYGSKIALALPYAVEFRVGSALGVNFIYIFILFVSIIYFTNSLGGMPLTAGYPRENLVKIGGLGKLLFASYFAAKPVAALAAYLWATTKKKMIQMMSAFSILFILITMLLTDSRIRSLEIIVTVVVVFAFCRRKVSVGRLILLGAVMLFLAVVVVPYVEVGVAGYGWSLASAEVWKAIINSQKRLGNELDNLLVIIDSVSNGDGLLFGGTMLGFVSRILPLIPDDEPPFLHDTQYFVSKFFPEAADKGLGFPVTYFGALYWNYSYIGVIVGSFFLGVFYKVLWTYCLIRRRGGVVVYASMYMSLFGIYFGSLTQAIVYQGLTLMACIFIISIVSGGRFKLHRAAIVANATKMKPEL